MKNKPQKPTFREEEILWKKGFNYIIGIDEVGRGAFAGPVVTAAVIFDPKKCSQDLFLEIDDSKRLRSLKRKTLAKQIKDQAIFWEISTKSVAVINKYGIGKATNMAFRKSLSSIVKLLDREKPYVLVDGFHVRYIRGVGLKHEKAIVKGDQKSMSIAAASIIAKDHRDRLMKALSKRYPRYGLGRNKGYGTKEHQMAIKKFGLTRIHRRSFKLQRFLAP
ncbi:MAG: ribonuclease HII [Candidatus Levybacteria bacterium RBG_16_35_11]|nr:MAG: ribonuclease HII [Candidatus Levybacteria bacterium RBG_16_35_11]